MRFNKALCGLGFMAPQSILFHLSPSETCRNTMEGCGIRAYHRNQIIREIDKWRLCAPLFSFISLKSKGITDQGIKGYIKKLILIFIYISHKINLNHTWYTTFVVINMNQIYERGLLGNFPQN